MSYNAHKINDKAPNAAGAVSLAVDDLSDVDATSVTSGQTLAYNATTSKWEPSALPTGAQGYIFMGTDINNYSTTASPSTYTSGAQLYFQNTNAHNTISGSTISLAPSSSIWYGDIELPAGKYSIMSNSGALFSSTGYMAFSWKRTDTGDTISSIGVKGADITTYPAAEGSCLGAFILSATTTIRCTIDGVTGLSVSATQTNGQAIVPSFVLIRKVT